MYGRIQSWVALDRAIKMATTRARPADPFRWRTERDAIYNQVFEKGWNPRIGGFTQFYGGEVLDSSLHLLVRRCPRPGGALERALISAAVNLDHQLDHGAGVLHGA